MILVHYSPSLLDTIKIVKFLLLSIFVRRNNYSTLCIYLVLLILFSIMFFFSLLDTIKIVKFLLLSFFESRNDASHHRLGDFDCPNAVGQRPLVHRMKKYASKR